MAQRVPRPVSRITIDIDDGVTVARPADVHPLARPEYDRGRALAELRLERMVLVLQPDPRQQLALEDLLEAQQDPGSPEYRQWLTPQAFGERFGLSSSDLDQILNWLERHGFDAEPVSPSGRSIVFSGTAAQVAEAFHTEVHVYYVGGERHYANAAAPEIPLAFDAVVLGIASVHDFHSAPLHTIPEIPAPDWTSGESHYLTPADFSTIYDLGSLYSQAIDGTRESIAIVGRTNINPSDVQSFRSLFGLPVNNPTVVLDGPNPGVVSSSEETEATLDVEWSGAVARNAAIQLVVSASTNATDGIVLSAQYIVNHNLAPVMSLSFGNCEAAYGTSGNQFWNALWQQAAAEGITVVVASGDNGAAGCSSPTATTATAGHAVNALCSSPYSTCVGGTQFNDASNPGQYWSVANTSAYGSALSYIPEMAWNQSGGGASAIYPKPAWQSGPGVPADGWRDVPDVALTASTHDGYVILMNGGLYLVGGTSAAAPSWAGLMAMAALQTGARIGNANPSLYALASNQTSGGPAVFHDIITGINSVPSLTGYSAGAGYDLATGLGSVDGAALVNQWRTGSVSTPIYQLTPSASSVAVTAGSHASVTLTAAPSGGFNGNVALSVGALPAGLSASFSVSTINGGSGSSVLTLTATPLAATGSFNITVTGVGGGITRNLTLPATVSSPCTYSINPASLNASASAGNYTAQVTATNGCSWTAVSNNGWIGVSGGASGTGSGNVSYSLAANNVTGTRSGSLTIAGTVLVVMQAASSMTTTLGTASESFSGSGGNGSVTVTAPQSLAWAAISNSSWVTITSRASGTGNGTVTFAVAANAASAPRTALLTIAGLTFSVIESTACTYTAAAGVVAATSTGYRGTVSVTTGIGCPWTSASSAAWLTIATDASASGSGTMTFNAAPNNTNAMRSAILTVAGHAFIVTEAKP